MVRCIWQEKRFNSRIYLPSKTNQKDKMKHLIARHIEGISLNGREYCLDDEGNIVFFESFESAKAHLLEHLQPDSTEEDLDIDIDNGVIMIEPYEDSYVINAS